MNIYDQLQAVEDRYGRIRRVAQRPRCGFRTPSVSWSSQKKRLQAVIQ